MGRIIFVLGGARSGKSSFAARLAAGYSRVAYIATGEGLDPEMRDRIRAHRASRPRAWKTIEESLDVSRAIKRLGWSRDLIIIDCLTLLVSNHIMKRHSEGAIRREIIAILSELRASRTDAIIVSNEVGLGIVPENGLARRFRDIAGRVNQIVAKEADQVFFTVSGLSRRIK